MKGKLMKLGYLLLMSALVIGGCTPAQSGQSPRPSDPVGARDAVLVYLNENDGDRAPAANLAWTEKHTKPEGLVGQESYEYTAGDWAIAVAYPVAAPENIVYTIGVYNQSTGFRWEGKVDAQGQVTETSSGRESSQPSNPNPNMPNPASVYCEEHGGKVELRQGASGGVAGICVFADGSECDEWAYFRGECKPGGTPVASSTPAAETELTSDGWKIYRNETLGYRFDYPADARIEIADDPLKTVSIIGPLVGRTNWPVIFINHPGDREDYRPPIGADLAQWLTDHYLLTDERQPDTQIAGITAVHTRFSRSPQAYASDSYYFAWSGQLYSIVILHTGDREDWALYDRFLTSFQFDQAADEGQSEEAS